VPTKDGLNEVLNVKELIRFSRSYQEFYIMWMLLMDIDGFNLKERRDELLSDINLLFRKLKNMDEEVVDGMYVEDFLTLMAKIKEKYNNT
jgi:hypothetical protein